MPIENCFGDEETSETDYSGSNAIVQKLVLLLGSSDDELTLERLDNHHVQSIHLVGSFISGCHQELLFYLKQDDGIMDFVRISRVNGTDTFQVVTKQQQQQQQQQQDQNDLPILRVFDTFSQEITLGQVMLAFDEARNLMKRYDQGDCHSLSQMICETLVPGSFPVELDW